MLQKWKGIIIANKNRFNYNFRRENCSMAYDSSKPSSSSINAFSKITLPSLYFCDSSTAYSYIHPRRSSHSLQDISLTLCRPVSITRSWISLHVRFTLCEKMKIRTYVHTWVTAAHYSTLHFCYSHIIQIWNNKDTKRSLGHRVPMVQGSVYAHKCRPGPQQGWMWTEWPGLGHRVTTPLVRLNEDRVTRPQTQGDYSPGKEWKQSDQVSDTGWLLSW